MHIINITVRNKVAVNPAQDRYVCGNSDYIVRFDFDAEWDAFETKTARFIKEDGTYKDQVFSGNECPVPVISDTYKIMVGVFAGNLSTTTAAYVPAKKSILCGGGTPADPEPDVYRQVMDTLNRNTEAAQGTAEKLTEAFGDGALYLIRQCGTDSFDRTYDEIDAAIKAGKTCILTDSQGRVHLFSNYSAIGKLIFRAIEHGEPVGGGSYTTLTERELHIDKDGKSNNIAISPVKTPTPNKLTIEQNGATVVFDGRESANIKIEGGVPDPGKAFQQLVSDADGKAVWQEQIAYKHVKSGMVELFAGTLAVDAEEPGTFSTTTPLDAIPEDGKTYEVTINGTKHNPAARPYEMNGVVWAVLLGNAGIINPDDYDDNGEPFVLIVPLPEHQAMVGGASVICIADTEVASVTLSIRGEGTVTDIKKIDPDLLDSKTIVLTIDADGNVTSDTPFAESIKMTNGELQNALKIVQTGSYGGQTSTLEADVQVRRRKAENTGEALEIAFRQFADPADVAAGKEVTSYIYWSEQGLYHPPIKLYSLPVMNNWGYDRQTYYLRSVGGVWQPVSIDQMKKDLGLT